jgi:hypothetical protein
VRKKLLLSACLIVTLAVPVLAEDAVTLVPADENAAEANVFMTAKLIAIHRDEDRIEVRDNDGKKKTLTLADDATIEGSLEPGRDVMLSIRHVGAQERVTSVKSSVPSSVRNSAPTPSPFVFGGAVGGPKDEPAATLDSKGAGSLGADAAPMPIEQAVRAYETAVARISDRARTAEQAFSSYTRACGHAKSTATTADREEWSAILEGNVASSEGDDQCGILLVTAARLGKEVQNELSVAEDAARRSGVLPGVMRQIRTTYGMDWSGWDR